MPVVGARDTKLILADGREAIDGMSSWWADELHHRNLLWLTAVDGFDVVVDAVARIS